MSGDLYNSVFNTEICSDFFVHISPIHFFFILLYLYNHLPFILPASKKRKNVFPFIVFNLTNMFNIFFSRAKYFITTPHPEKKKKGEIVHR